MSWVTVREAVRVAIAVCLDADTAGAGPVEWVDRAVAHRWTADVWADLRLSPSARTHHGETRACFDEGTDSLTEVRVGWSHFTVTALVQTESQEPGENAVDVASQIQLRLQHPTILAGLKAAKVAIRAIGPVIDATYTDSEARASSQAAIELHLATVESWSPAAVPGGYFDHVIADGDGDLEGQQVEVIAPDC